MRRMTVATAGVLLVLGLGGCIERAIRVTSDPPGATVWLNDEHVGRTPVETDFTFYGVYDVRLEKDGFEPIMTSREAEAPIHEYPVIDLVAEALPLRFDNTVEWHFDLEPVAERVLPEAEARRLLIDRARTMREESAVEMGERGGGE